eukprot:6186107-Pleurochrysis_carterae.AAC.2
MKLSSSCMGCGAVLRHLLPWLIFIAAPAAAEVMRGFGSLTLQARERARARLLRDIVRSIAASLDA